MSIVKISPQGQVKIPKSTLEKLKVGPGDYLEFEDTDGNIIVRPKKLIDADQSWFWTKKWQEGEKEASEDKEAGRISPVFTTAEEGIKYLKTKRRSIKRKNKKR